MLACTQLYLLSSYTFSGHELLMHHMMLFLNLQTVQYNVHGIYSLASLCLQMAICLCKSAPTQHCLRLPVPAGPMLVNKRTWHSVRQPTDRSAHQGCDIEAGATINRTDDPKRSKHKTSCTTATSISNRSPGFSGNLDSQLHFDIPYALSSSTAFCCG